MTSTSSDTNTSSTQDETPRSDEGKYAGERQAAPSIKPPSGSRRFADRFFGPESRSGRFLRSLLRWTALTAALLLVGALAVYLLLYQPAVRQLEQTRQQLAATTAELRQTQDDLAAAQQARETSETRDEASQERLNLELTRVQVLRAKNSLAAAQVAVAGKDKDAAGKALDTAESTLEQTMARLEKLDASAPSTIEALFTLVRNDLGRDLALAGQSIDRLSAELARLDNLLK